MIAVLLIGTVPSAAVAATVEWRRRSSRRTWPTGWPGPSPCAAAVFGRPPPPCRRCHGRGRGLVTADGWAPRTPLSAGPCLFPHRALRLWRARDSPTSASLFRAPPLAASRCSKWNWRRFCWATGFSCCGRSDSCVGGCGGGRSAVFFVDMMAAWRNCAWRRRGLTVSTWRGRVAAGLVSHFLAAAVRCAVRRVHYLPSQSAEWHPLWPTPLRQPPHRLWYRLRHPLHKCRGGSPRRRGDIGSGRRVRQRGHGISAASRRWPKSAARRLLWPPAMAGPSQWPAERRRRQTCRRW